VNTLKTDREECRLRLQKEGIETEDTPRSPVGLVVGKRFDRNASPAFRDGWFEIQDEGSQLVSLFARPIPGSVVIDACAGAGGKTLHLAEMMKNEGEIIAIDSGKRRLEELSLRARRAGISCVKTMVVSDLRPDNLDGKADLVLVDAPCSGSGTIRRNPSLKWQISETMVDRYASRQQEILDFNSAFVRSGGALCYVTCSLLRKENEEVLRTFLEKHPQFALVDCPTAGLDLRTGVTDQFVHLLPHRHNTDGYFIGLMRRSA